MVDAQAAVANPGDGAARGVGRDRDADRGRERRPADSRSDLQAPELHLERDLRDHGSRGSGGARAPQWLGVAARPRAPANLRAGAHAGHRSGAAAGRRHLRGHYRRRIDPGDVVRAGCAGGAHRQLSSCCAAGRTSSGAWTSWFRHGSGRSFRRARGRSIAFWVVSCAGSSPWRRCCQCSIRSRCRRLG